VDESAVGKRGDARAGESAQPVPDPELTDREMTDPELAVVCRQVVELVTDYLEGALPGQLHAAVERHLQLCVPCAVYVEQMRRTSAALRDAPVESIDPRTRAELVSAFRDLIPKSSGGGPA
jgi:anti-sigma factor RsiW